MKNGSFTLFARVCQLIMFCCWGPPVYRTDSRSKAVGVLWTAASHSMVGGWLRKPETLAWRSRRGWGRGFQAGWLASCPEPQGVGCLGGGGGGRSRLTTLHWRGPDGSKQLSAVCVSRFFLDMAIWSGRKCIHLIWQCPCTCMRNRSINRALAWISILTR